MDTQEIHSKWKNLLRLLRELFLLTLGIYLALVINNWNEDRKERSFEQFYLSKLLTDVDRSISNLNLHLSLNQEQLTGAKRLDQLLDQGLQANRDSLKIYLNSFNRNPKFQNTNFSYQSLVRSGDYPLIRNKKIRSALDEYYLDFIPSVVTSESYYLDRLYQHFFPIKEEVLLAKTGQFYKIERLFTPLFKEAVYILPDYIEQEANQIKIALKTGHALKLALEEEIRN